MQKKWHHESTLSNQSKFCPFFRLNWIPQMLCRRWLSAIMNDKFFKFQSKFRGASFFSPQHFYDRNKTFSTKHTGVEYGHDKQSRSLIR